MYKFTPQQAGKISNQLSQNGLTPDSLKVALFAYAANYPLADAGQVVNDAGYDFATLGNSNSGGIVISHRGDGTFYGTMDVEGMTY